MERSNGEREDVSGSCGSEVGAAGWPSMFAEQANIFNGLCSADLQFFFFAASPPPLCAPLLLAILFNKTTSQFQKGVSPADLSLGSSRDLRPEIASSAMRFDKSNSP
jgi:hypothetical protein